MYKYREHINKLNLNCVACFIIWLDKAIYEPEVRKNYNVQYEYLTIVCKEYKESMVKPFTLKKKSQSEAIKSIYSIL